MDSFSNGFPDYKPTVRHSRRSAVRSPIRTVLLATGVQPGNYPTDARNLRNGRFERQHRSHTWVVPVTAMSARIHQRCRRCDGFGGLETGRVEVPEESLCLVCAYADGDSE